mmetsp:Transcript_79097/g.228732  ORF Transcript_79097/g.228732 Transcript_79097/m.228732 type:complete len:246 (+) Transcript_79097:90-827(+)
MAEGGLIEAAVNDPQVHATVRMEAERAAERAKATYGESARTYIVHCLTPPRVDLSMFTLRQTNWKASFAYWNILWTQAAAVAQLACIASNFYIAILEFSIFKLLFGTMFNMIKGGFHIAFAVFMGHFGWFFVVETGCRCSGDYDYFVIGLAYASVSLMFMFSNSETFRWLICIVVALPTVYLVLACWNLGCGTAAREIGGMFTNKVNEHRLDPQARASRQTQSPAGTASQQHRQEMTGFELTRVA